MLEWIVEVLVADGAVDRPQVRAHVPDFQERRYRMTSKKVPVGAHRTKGLSAGVVGCSRLQSLEYFKSTFDFRDQQLISLQNLCAWFLLDPGFRG